MTPDIPAGPTRLQPLPARLFGVLTSPRATFAALAVSPRWLGALIATTLLTVAGHSLFLSTETGRQALLDQQVVTLESFGQTVDDEAYVRMQDSLDTGLYLQAGSILVAIPVVTLLFSAVAYGACSVAFGGSATFAQVLAVVAHSGAVTIVQQLFVLPLNYSRESMSSPTNVSVFFPMLDEGSFFASLLGTIDLFLVWWVVVVAIGLAVLYRRRTQPIAGALFAVYGLIAVAIAAIKSALGGQ